MPPTNEQLLLNSGSVQITPPQVQEGIAPTPIYKEGGISMPSPQAWIGPIDYGFNWYDIGAKAFKVAGDIYKDVLDYNLRRRQQQATQDLTEMQTISVEKPDPTYTPEQQREWLIGQNSRLNKKAKESLLKQGLTQEQIDGVFGISATGERLDKPVNPADYILPASDMNSVLQIVRYNNLTSEEFKTNIQKVEDSIFERAKSNWFDGSSKQFGNLDNPDLTPEQIWQNRQKAIDELRRSTYNNTSKNEFVDTIIQETDPAFTQTFKTKLINDYNKKQEEATYRLNIYMDQWLSGKISLNEFINISTNMFDNYNNDSKRAEIYLTDPTFDTSTEAANQKLKENPDLAWQVNSNKVKQLDISLSVLQKQLLNADSQTVNEILSKQREIYRQRTEALNNLVTNTEPELLSEKERREFEFYKQQKDKLIQEAGQEKVKEIKVSEVKPLLDSVQSIETQIQNLNSTVTQNTTPEQLTLTLNKIKQLEQQRLSIIKNIVNIPDDPNRPPELTRVIDSYKQLYNKKQEETITQNINTIVNRSILDIQTKIKQEDQRIDLSFQLLASWQSFSKTTRLPTKEEFYDFIVNSGLDTGGAETPNAFDSFIELLPEKKDQVGVLNSINNKDAKAKLQSNVYRRVLSESGIGLKDDGTLINPTEVNLKIQQDLAKILSRQDGNTQDSLNIATKSTNTQNTGEEASNAISQNRPGIPEKEASDGVMFKWQNLMQDITPKPSMFDVFKVWESSSFDQISFQIATQDESRKRFVDLMLFNPQFINKQDMKTWIRSGWNEVTSGTNVKDIDQKTYTLGFFGWLSNRIPSGTNQQGLEQSKFNSDFLLKEYDKYWQAHLQTKDRLKQFGLDAKTMRILDIAATSGMESTSGWFSNYGGTKIMDYIQTINPTNGDTALSMYANMLGITDVSWGPDWDTDKAKALVRASSEIGGDFISPFILAESTLPSDASPDLIVDTALQYADQFGFNLQTTLQVTGSNGNWSTAKTPIASTDSLNRTLGLASPTAPIKNIPYAGSENFPMVYSATAVQQLGLTAENLVYGKILPNLKRTSDDGKVTPWMPNEEQIQDYLITRDNILDIAASFYPGSVTADSLKTDPDYPIMQFLFDWFDDKTDKPINERLANAFENNQAVKNWVFRYSGDDGKTEDIASSSRALWLTKVLSSSELTAKPFIEIVLNSSAHIPTEVVGKPALEAEYSIFRSLDQYEGSFARQTRGEKDYLPSQVNEVLPNSKDNSIFMPVPTSGEPYVLIDPISRKQLVLNQNSEYSLKINNALQRGYDASWYDKHQNETWLFIDLETLEPIEIKVSNNLDKNLSFNTDKNIFIYKEYTGKIPGDTISFSSTYKGNVLPIRRLK